MEIAPKINPSLRTLLGPGPNPVNPRVLQSLSLPIIGVENFELQAQVLRQLL